MRTRPSAPDSELFVPVLEEVLSEIEFRRPSKADRVALYAPSAPSTTSASADTVPASVSNGQASGAGVRRLEAMPETEPDPGRPFGGIKKRLVELRPADRIDRTRAVRAVAPEAGLVRDRMDHPAMHGQCLRKGMLAQTDLLQRGQTTS